MMSCFVESAEAISSGIFLSFWSVWTLKVAMKMSFFPFIGLELTFFCFGRFGFSSWFRLQPETSLQDALLSWARDERCGMNALGFVSFHTCKDWFDTCGRYSIQVWVVLCIRTFVPSQNNQHWLLWIASPLEAWTNVSVFRSFCYPTSYLADMCFALPKGDLLFCPALLIGYSQLTSISRSRSLFATWGAGGWEFPSPHH